MEGGGQGLDLACGQGRNAFYLASRGFSMFSVDESSEAIASLGERADERHLDVSGKVVNLTELDIEPQRYRIIVAYTALDHVDAVAGERLAKAMMAGLEPGGYCSPRCSWPTTPAAQAAAVASARLPPMSDIITGRASCAISFQG